MKFVDILLPTVNFQENKMKSLRNIKMLLVLLSISCTLGTNAQLLTTTEKIPLGEFEIYCELNDGLTSLSPTAMLTVAHNHSYQFSLRNKKGICVRSLRRPSSWNSEFEWDIWRLSINKFFSFLRNK